MHADTSAERSASRTSASNRWSDSDSATVALNAMTTASGRCPSSFSRSTYRQTAARVVDASLHVDRANELRFGPASLLTRCRHVVRVGPGIHHHECLLRPFPDRDVP